MNVFHLPPYYYSILIFEKHYSFHLFIHFLTNFLRTSCMILNLTSFKRLICTVKMRSLHRVLIYKYGEMVSATIIKYL